MTHSEDVLQKLRALKPAFKDMNIRRLRVFGSVARNDAGPHSDIDLLIDYDTPPDLLEISGIQLELQDRLGVRVDLVTEKRIFPALRDAILSEAQDV